MKTTALLFTALCVAAFAAKAEQAEQPNAERGKDLHDQFCFQCHKTEVYTRENRLVKSHPSLVAQVRRCELTLGLQWFDEDIHNTAAYLNSEFYKFPGDATAP